MLQIIKRFLKRFYDGDEAFRKLLIKQGATIGKNVQIVDRFKFQYEPWYAKLIEIEDGVVLSAGVRLVNHDSSYSNVFGDLPVKYGKIFIRQNTYIGVNSIILCGVTIGENCIIGAGSVVNKDIPSNSVAAGNPVKIISSIDEGLAKYKNRMSDRYPNVHYIDLGGSYWQIKKKYGRNTTYAIISKYLYFFESLQKDNKPQ
jgi:acetyltransferase-like isoleucine patch superfamily enzyme